LRTEGARVAGLTMTYVANFETSREHGKDPERRVLHHFFC
jgi:hypothetical protein